MAARRSPSKKTSATAPKLHALGSGRKFPPEAFDDQDEVSPEAVQAIQDRADKVLKNGKWVVVDGYAGKK